MNPRQTRLRRAALCIALGACLSAVAPVVVAQQVTGAVAGRATAGDQVVVNNPATGLTRTASVGSDGNYRLGQLPIGNYSLQVVRDGQPIGEPLEVTVSLGGTTTVNLGSQGGIADLAAVQVVVWLGVAWRTGFDFPSTPEPEPVPAEPGSDAPASADASGDAASGDAAATRAALTSVSLWRSPTAVFLTMFFALQSMNAYLQMGWMPQMYVDAGVSRDTASVALSLVGALNILGGLLMPTIIDRARSLAPFPLVFAVLTAAGYLGILLAPTTTPLLWAFLLGIGGFCFPTAIALIPARSRSPLVTARLSGFVQPMGYFLAGLGPFAIGLVY